MSTLQKEKISRKTCQVRNFRWGVQGKYGVKKYEVYEIAIIKFNTQIPIGVSVTLFPPRGKRCIAIGSESLVPRVLFM